MPISFAKVESQAPALLSFAKSAGVSLTKFGLADAVAEVELVLDYSASMKQLYASGQMQTLAERVLALAVLLDDDGKVPVTFFDNDAELMGDIDLKNYTGSIDRFRAKRKFGGTQYAPAIEAVVARHKKLNKGGLFRKAANMPRFVIFQTDGRPQDEAATRKALREASEYGIFFKFLSIGEAVAFLQKLDDLKDRRIDNANYQPVSSLDAVSDSQLYDMLLEEWPDWLKLAKAEGLIA